MESTQLAQQVTWLDEQHRRDRSELATLQQRVESQNTQILELSRKLQEAEGRLASTSAQLTRFSQVDQALGQLKEEVVFMLRREEEQRQLAEREANRMRLIERETHMKAINDLRQQVRSISKLQDELELRKAEEKRLGEAVLNLRQNLVEVARQAEAEGWTKRISYLEELRRQENKLVTQLQQEMSEVMKRTEALRGHMDVQEKSVGRLETRLNTLWNMRDEMRSEVVRAQEAVLLGEEERNRRVAGYSEQFQAYSKEMEGFNDEFKIFRDQFAADSRLVSQLTQLEERLKRDQNQVAELQRLAEERMRKEFEQFQAEDERRWRKFEATAEHRWNEQNRLNVQVAERFPPVEEQLKGLVVQISELWEVQQTLVRLRSAEVERYMVEFSKRWEDRTR